MATNISKTKAPSLILVSQLGMVHAKTPQNGGVEIVDIDRVLHYSADLVDALGH
jgi:hypothetical protein